MIFIANEGADDLVADEYYKNGLAINRKLEKLERAEQLGIEFVYQGVINKLTAYMEILEKTGLQDDQICFAGDDWIDLSVLQRVGLAVTVPAADHEVKNRVHWVTGREGGDGAVREICQLIMSSQGHDKHLLDTVLNR